MGFSIVRYLVTHAGLEDKIAANFHSRVPFTLQAKQYVTFAAPMVCDIARCVFDRASRDGAEMLRAPLRHVNNRWFNCRTCKFDIFQKIFFPKLE